MQTILDDPFQFHKGTIRTNKQAVRRLMNKNFNSIKVRLERTQTTWVSCSLKFQFHKGTIRTSLFKIL